MNGRFRDPLRDWAWGTERRLSAASAREGGASRSGVLRQRGIAAVRLNDTAWALPAVRGAEQRRARNELRRGIGDFSDYHAGRLKKETPSDTHLVEIGILNHCMFGIDRMGRRSRR